MRLTKAILASRANGAFDRYDSRIHRMDRRALHDLAPENNQTNLDSDNHPEMNVVEGVS